MKKLGLVVSMAVMGALAFVGCSNPSGSNNNGTSNGNDNVEPPVEMEFAGTEYNDAGSPVFTILNSDDLSEIGTVKIVNNEAVLTIGENTENLKVAVGDIPAEYKEMLKLEGFSDEDLGNLGAFSLNKDTVATNVSFSLDFDNLKATIEGADYIMLPDPETGRDGGYDIWSNKGLYFAEPGPAPDTRPTLDDNAFKSMETLGTLEAICVSDSDANRKMFKYSTMNEAFLNKFEGEPSVMNKEGDYKGFDLDKNFYWVELTLKGSGENVTYEIRFIKKDVVPTADGWYAYIKNFENKNAFDAFIASAK